MNALVHLTEQDFEKMAQDITKISKEKSESELFQVIGNALHDSGYGVSKADNSDLIEPKMFDQTQEKINLLKSVDFVENTDALSAEEAEKEGGRFWRRFTKKLKKMICNNTKFRELLTGESSTKDYLIVGIPLVVTALGMTALNPVLLAIAAAVLALIAKVGFAAYCDLPDNQ